MTEVCLQSCLCNMSPACCRLCGSYELLHLLCLSDVLTMLTGGLVEWFNFREELPDDMFDILLQALDSGSIITCSIHVRIVISPTFEVLL